MSTPRIRTDHQRGEVYPNVWSDFDWAAENRQALLEKYGACVLLVYQKSVVGIGKTLQEAEQDAEKRLPPTVKEITPITYLLGHLHRIYKIGAQPSSEA